MRCLVQVAAIEHEVDPLLKTRGDEEAIVMRALRLEGRLVAHFRATYGWNIYATGTVLDDEVEVVSPGWGHFARKVPPYVPRLHGDFYRRCWNTVLNNPKPKIVMIVTFNDYLENTAVWTADITNLTDAEKWEDPDGALNPSLYWNITVEKIAALRRSKP